jgi:hypothetical protein
MRSKDLWVDLRFWTATRHTIWTSVLGHCPADLLHDMSKAAFVTSILPGKNYSVNSLEDGWPILRAHNCHSGQQPCYAEKHHYSTGNHFKAASKLLINKGTHSSRCGGNEG